jgi:glycosyltransferase involved in cell wall biosynthesis
MEKIALSVVVPFFNEEDNLPDLHDELFGVLQKLGVMSEIIYVDDGSVDESISKLKKAIAKKADSKIKIIIISFIRNFGQTAAVSAGIDRAKGEFISFLDADLQNDPKDVSRFYKKVGEGYDAVLGWRKERRDASLRSIFSKVANTLIQLLFKFPFHDVGCSARIVRKSVLKNIRLYGELHRIMPVLIYLGGARTTELVVSHRERRMGKSKYGFDRVIKILIDIITVKFLSSYGTRPAYVFGTIGLGSILTGSITLMISVYKKLFLGVFIHRDPLFLITIFLMLIGMQFVMSGLIAELLVRTYFESQKKLIYEIKSENIY